LLSSRGDASRLAPAVGLILIAGALVVAARGLEVRHPWYLASDQFAFLTFADDLRDGRVFHDPSTFRQLFPFLSGSTGNRLVLFQTYHLDGDRLYSQYPPGYPLLIALAGALGGSTAVHLLNPICFLLVVVLLATAGWSIAPPTHRWAVAACAAWLVLILPTEIHYWGITVTRDLPTHLLGLVSILTARTGRLRTSALALGAAFTMRPDALLYGVPALVFVSLQRPSRRSLLQAGCCFLIAGAPAFAYNAITGGHPLAFPQAREFRDLLARLGTPTALAAGASQTDATPYAPNVGGFQLSNLPKTLPRTLQHLREGFDGFWPLTVVVLAGALLRRPSLAATVVVYPTLAVVFYSCWGHSDPRYLIGAILGAIVASSLGLVALFEALTLERPRRSRALGLVVCTILFAHSVATAENTTAATTIFGLGLLIGGLLLSPIGTRLRAARWLAFVPVLVLATWTAANAPAGMGQRDPFQRGQIDRSRRTLESSIPPGALVVTTDRLGRPAENIAYYTHADAVYLSDLQRLRVPPQQPVGRALRMGRRVFLLLDAAQGTPLPPSARWRFRIRHITTRTDKALYDWFIDPRRAPRGAALYEVVLAR